MTGKVLSTQDYTTMVGTNELTIDLTEQAAGTYLISVEGETTGSQVFHVTKK